MKKLLLVLVFVAFSCSESKLEGCEDNNCYVITKATKEYSVNYGDWFRTEIEARKECDGEVFTFTVGNVNVPNVGQVYCGDIN